MTGLYQILQFFNSPVFSATRRSGRSKMLLTPMGGWVGVKPAALRVFLVQSGRFLVVQKFRYLNLGLIFEFRRHVLEFWRYIFEFCHHIFEFWCNAFEFWR